MSTKRSIPTPPQIAELLRDLSQSSDNCRRVAELASRGVESMRRDLEAVAGAAALMSERLTRLAEQIDRDAANGGAS